MSRSLLAETGWEALDIFALTDSLWEALSLMEERQQNQKQQTPFSIFTSSHSAVNVAIEVLKRIDAAPTRILIITSYRGFPKKVYTTIGRLVARCAKQKCGPSGQLWAFPRRYVSIPAALERQPPANPTWSAVQSTGEPSAGSRQTHSSLYPQHHDSFRRSVARRAWRRAMQNRRCPEQRPSPPNQ